MTDEEIKKASACCVKGDCFRCPLDCIHNCRTALREGMNDILHKQQLELVLKRNTINDLNNKLTEKQSENENLQSLCASKDVTIKEQQAEIERLESLLNQLFKDVDYKLQYIYELEKKLESDQAEAIKEFAERLRLRAIKTRFDAMYGAVIEISNDTITEIVKELEGGENA